MLAFQPASWWFSRLHTRLRLLCGCRRQSIYLPQGQGKTAWGCCRSAGRAGLRQQPSSEHPGRASLRQAPLLPRYPYFMYLPKIFTTTEQLARKVQAEGLGIHCPRVGSRPLSSRGHTNDAQLTSSETADVGSCPAECQTT